MKTSSIETISGITPKEFKKQFLIPQRPVVIKGHANNYPAGEKWTIEYIKELCGSVMVDVFDNSHSNKGSAFTNPDLKMPFRDYVNAIIENKPTTLRMFLFNMFKSKPELRNDFPCPDIFKGILGRIGYMFFGAKGIKVRIHQDIDMSNVLLTQFYGRKKVVLVSPKYSELLYQLPYNTYSLIDLDNPDYEKYPGLKYIEVQECILEHGDSLYMPSGFWHYITYIDGGFSVSYRKMAHSLSAKKQGLLNMLVYMPFDKLMNKLQGEKWVMRKEFMAQEKANKAIAKLNEHKPIVEFNIQHHEKTTLAA
ncbi:MAG: cupin-like domain-containing protein [Bacteroidota bacterium]